MKIKIIAIGKIKNKNLFSEIEKLKKRIPRLEIIYLKEIKDIDPNIVKNKEYIQINSNLKNSELNILLTEKGKTYSTINFSNFLSKTNQDICFIISGPFGPDNKLLKQTPHHISLSEMTFTHEQALYMLIEQLYRHICFKNNINYTK